MAVLNDVIGRGTLASRPASGSTGELYYATDEGKIYFWTGSAWALFDVHDLIVAKGDLLSGSAADTLVKTAIGANGTSPVADSAQTGGFRWDTISAAAVIRSLTNKSGAGVVAGDVVIVDTTADDSFTTTTTASLERSIGIAQATIANNAAGNVLLSGYAALVNVAASVTRGHYMFTSTTAKQATGNATRAAGAFGQFLSTSATPTAWIWGVGDQTAAGGALTVQDEGTPLTTDATTLNFTGAGVTASGTGATKTINVPGGSGGTTLPLDVAPGSASSWDDEFPGSSLDAKWTNPITSTRTNTLSVANGWLQFEPSETGTGSTGVRGAWGIRQNAPTGSFRVKAKIASGSSGAGVDDSRVGIFVARSADSDAWILGMQTSAVRVVNLNDPVYSQTADWGANQVTDTNVPMASDSTLGNSGTWYRLDYDSVADTLDAYWSTNGVFWRSLATISSVLQLDRIGIAMWGSVADVRADHQAGCDWFRVEEF